MICIYAHKCNSDTCLHKGAHLANDFCSGGSCSWGEGTHCVPESKRERLELYLAGLLPSSANDIKGIAGAIMEIFGEEKEEV